MNGVSQHISHSLLLQKPSGGGLGAGGKRFWCTKLSMFHPHGAGQDVGVLLMKRMACIDDHCEVVKYARCFKCKEKVYSKYMVENGVDKNYKMGQCAVRVMEKEKGGARNPAHECSGADAIHAMRAALAA